MLRAILRNIQYALIVASFLLFMMGVERMQSFDHRMSPLSSSSSSSSSSWSPSHLMNNHHDDYSSEETTSNDNSNNNNLYSSFRVPNTQHQISFSKEFRIGLFRFVLPRLERLNDEEHSSEDPKHNNNLRPSAWKVPIEKRSKQEAALAFLLNTTEACSSKSMIASALVFAESVRTTQGSSSLFQLYAYHGQHNTSSEARCQNWLQSAGYELMPFPSEPSCWNDTARLLLQAHHVNADLVIPIQLPSLLMKASNSSSTTDNSSTNKKSAKTSSLLTLRPQRRRASSYSLQESIKKMCNEQHNNNNKLNQSTAESLPSWLHSPCDSFGMCPLSSSKDEIVVSLATFQDCPEPWKCSRTHCLKQQPALCRQQQEQWLRLRDKLREKLSTSANKVKLAL